MLLTADYRHLIAYEINAQGWNKRLGLEGLEGGRGGGGGSLKTVFAKEGGVQFSYVIILWG